MGSRTIAKLQSINLHVVKQIALDVVVLEIGTNNLVDESPEIVGSQIEDLVGLLLKRYSVRVVCICQVIPRGISHPDAKEFAQHAEILQQYLDVVLSDTSHVSAGVTKHFPILRGIFIWTMVSVV